MASVTNIRHQISKSILQVANKEMLESLQHGGEKELKTYIYRKMWYPDYRYILHISPKELCTGNQLIMPLSPQGPSFTDLNEVFSLPMLYEVQGFCFTTL